MNFSHYSSYHNAYNFNSNNNGLQIHPNDLMNYNFTPFYQNIQNQNYVLNQSYEIKTEENRIPEISRTPQIPELPVPTIQNIVCTINVGCKLDLKFIALSARNSEYCPKRFSAVIMRIRHPKTTSLIFSSGKLVCTGAKTEDLAKLAARKFGRIIQRMGFNVKLHSFQLQNVVGSCDVKFPICLEALEVSHREFVTYEPENFPGLIYRLLNTKIVILCFKSGKIILTGAKVKQEIDEAFSKIYPILKLFTYGKNVIKN